MRQSQKTADQASARLTVNPETRLSFRSTERRLLHLHQFFTFLLQIIVYHLDVGVCEVLNLFQ